MKLTKKLGLFIAAAVSTISLGCIAYGAEQIGASTGNVTVNFGLYDYVDYQISENKSFSQCITSERNYGGTQDIPNLDSGKSYYVRWRATGTSTYSSPMEVVTVPICKEGDAGEQVTCTKTTATIKWPAMSGATGYELFVDKTKKMEVSGTSATIDLNDEVDVKIYPIRKAATTSYVARDNAPSRVVTIYSVIPLPGQASKAKVSDTYSDAVKIKWDEVERAGGYEVEYSLYNGKKKKIADTDEYTTYSIKGSKSIFYRVRVRAYVKFGDTKVLADWSPYSYVCRDISFSDLKVVGSSSKKAKFKLYWKKVKGAKKYVIYMAKGNDAGYKMVKTTKKRSAIISKFKKRKISHNVNYYFKVVAVGKFGKVKAKSYSWDVVSQYCTK
ncbi:fibronectin type III domain-containing protein [Eubacterium sp.]|uniref:GH85 family endohexosaminidase C-terminal domain-containing protein n=1 Tax=Eubacterium sp. TaxID=142586 RepID=UPI0025FC98C4|nr:fibronectin type III domain-containing protein [Eubacterium sp.]MCR5628192.1 fibronectin type III domain-containing protein [Eubacterium sp.]